MRNGSDNGQFEDVENPPPLEGSRAGEETRKSRFKLWEVAWKGDWNMDEDILEENEVEDILAKISLKGNTALHIAAGAACSNFGIKLLLEVEKINHLEYLLKKNDTGNTAFWVAAASGNVELAGKMLEKNSDLVSIRGREDLPYRGREDLPYQGREDKLPLYIAAVTGRREMVELLYEPAKAHLTTEDLIELLVTLIETGLFHVAVKLVKDHPQIITTASDKNQGIWETILNCSYFSLVSISRSNLATDQPLTATASDKNQGIWEKICKFIPRSSISEVAPEAFEELVELLLEEVMRLVDSKILLEIMRKPIFAAAEQGNEKFLEIILRKYPDLIFEVDENNYSIFHFAVMNRHANIFGLIDENCSSKYLLTKNTDKEGNTILHLAARLPPSDRLTTGAEEVLPVHIRWECWWFEKASEILPRRLVGAKNNEGKTAEAIFTEQHKEMRLDAEKRIKDTSNSMLMAATIITTITFAAIFQLPGGTDPKRGVSNLAGHSFFTAFVFFDSMSLILSSVSIFIFVHIFLSKFGEYDFQRILPRMLAIGFLTFRFSVFAMLAAFFIAVRILFNPWTVWILLALEIFICWVVIDFLHSSRERSLLFLTFIRGRVSLVRFNVDLMPLPKRKLRRKTN